MLHWRAVGLIAPAYTPAPVGATDRLVVVSGSCSPATEGQIRRAMQDGFAGIRVEPGDTVLQDAMEHLGNGRNVVLYSALGPSDCGTPKGEELGRYLGTLLREDREAFRRAPGGWFAAVTRPAMRYGQLGIDALTFAGLLTPGAPLCRGHALDAAMNGLELVLKGGQVGPENFFEFVQKGNHDYNCAPGGRRQNGLPDNGQSAQNGLSGEVRRGER